MSSYKLVDHPVLINYLFHPRKDFTPCPADASDLFVPVEDGLFISCRFYQSAKGRPWILYFHGNGEVVSDYDDISRLYTQNGMNLVVADYRGYGASGGMPSFGAMIEDAHRLFEAIRNELAMRGYPDDLWIMGRSLGSVSALELASHYPEKIKGLIIESGFINAVRIIKYIELPIEEAVLAKLDNECLDKAGKITVKSLIIHGQADNLVPPGEARYLYENLGAVNKQLLIIPDAGHNDIMFVGMEQYFDAIKEFTKSESF